MMAARDRDREDEELLAFGASLCDEVRRLKNNDPEFKRFLLDGVVGASRPNAEHYSDRGWELLGRYIAENDYLTDLDIRTQGHIGGAQLSLLCRTIVGSRSLRALRLGSDIPIQELHLGLGGIQSLVPFLKNARNLASLNIWNSRNVDSRCFELLVRALDGRPIEELQFTNCNVDDMTPLQDCSLPHLMHLSMDKNNIQLIPPLDKYTNLSWLYLSGNNVEKEGCRSLANLLQNESSSLTILFLQSNDIGDEAAEILANSIRRNTMLTTLFLSGNKFSEAGFRAFLKLLNDSSSIERTYNSNHTLQQLELPAPEDDSNYTLRRLELPEDDDSCQTFSTISTLECHIEFALGVNIDNRGDSHAIGRAKIVATQLNSATRRELCHLQGIEYSSSNLLSDVEPALLPDLLAITGREHGQSELYLALNASAPDLTSLIDRGSMLEEAIAQNTSQIADLTSKNVSLNQRLEAFKRAENTPQTVAKERTGSNGCGNNKKRRRAGS